MTAAYLITLLAALASVVWLWWARECRLPAAWMVPNPPIDCERDLEKECHRFATWCRFLSGLAQMASVAHAVLYGFTISRVIGHQPPPFGTLLIWSGFCLFLVFLCLHTRKRFISLYERVNAIVKARELPPIA